MPEPVGAPDRVERIGDEVAEVARAESGTALGAQDSANHDRWVAVLNELWRHTRDSMDAGVTDHARARTSGETWTPPEGLGPMPAELLPRAAALRTSQQLAIARVEERLADVSSRLRAVKKIPQLAADVPVYLDRIG